MEKAKTRFARRPSGSESLPENEAEFERQKAREVERQQRKEEYERLGLGEKTKLGDPAGGFKFQ